MKYRKLRIAWSVAWSVAAVLLCVLWVRSYWWQEQDWRHTSGANALTGVGSVSSVIVIQRFQENLGYRPRADNSLFRWERTAAYWRLTLPTMLLSFVSLICASLPWLRWRFSLRTLLLATTLVAVVLGLIVYTARS